MAITRGYTFTPNETVTAAKLRALVEDAALVGLSWSSIESSMNVVSTGTGASKVGNVVCMYEPITLAGGCTPISAAQCNYVIRTPRGECALFNNGGFETRRFHGSAALAPLGRHVVPTTGVGGSQSQLALSFVQAGWSNSVGIGNIFGFVAHATGPSAYSETNLGPRVVIRGFCPIVALTSVTTMTITHHRYIYGPIGIGTLALNSTSVTHWDHTVGIAMSSFHPANSQTIPAWAFGCPLWRI